MQLPLEAAYQVRQGYPYGLADLTKFNQVQPAFARFILRNKTLGFPEAHGQVFLSEPRTQAQLPEDSLKDFLFWGKNALLHPSH